MLGVNKYEQAYVDSCRANLKAQVAAYKKVVASSTDEKAVAKFEPHFFNGLVLIMDGYFVHRLRKLEGKDGNPLNEVRNLSGSLTENGGTVVAETTFKLDPAKSVLGYEVGAKVALTADDFQKLSKAFFAEIEAKFT